ncbi:winged helix-turn-helix transcriptional regulator [Desulfoplanes sp.]
MTQSENTSITPCKVKTLGKRSYRCYFELTLSIIGGKWKPIILYHLGRMGVLRFGQLRRTMPEITERMLSRQLRELEGDGMVQRTEFQESLPRVEYSLTEMGRSIIPLLDAMRAWGVTCERQLGGEGLFPPEDGYEDPGGSSLPRS